MSRRRAKGIPRQPSVRRRVVTVGCAIVIAVGITGGYIVYVAPSVAPAAQPTASPTIEIPAAESAPPVHVINPDEVPDTTPVAASPS